jgi:histidinol-phosphatase (PHP family)
LTHTTFDRVLGSVHSARTAVGTVMIDDLYGTRPAAEVIRLYLAEVLRMVESRAPFEVLAHIDYPVRYWPPDAVAFTAIEFEAEFRAVLRALAGSGRALEVNTRVPLDPVVVRWWYEAGGSAVTFGSDAHEPGAVGAGFAAAAALVEACGFHAKESDPYAFWTRSRQAGRL